MASRDRLAFEALLRRVRKHGDTGRAPRWIVEGAEMGYYIAFGPPRSGVSEYNCYRLTERGESELTHVRMVRGR